MKALKLLFILILVTSVVTAREFHVAKTGNDKNPGTSQSPFLTIQAAANIAQPGDVITVHQGVCRERITPPRGGESETKRIPLHVHFDEERVENVNSELLTCRSLSWRIF